MKAAEKNGFVENFKTKLKKKDGTVLDSLFNSTPLRGPDGTIVKDTKDNK